MEGHDERADRLEGEANTLEVKGERLDDHIQEAKQDIERKVGDTSVPGAQPTSEELEEEVEADEAGEDPDAREDDDS